jgi:hypothetical protein
MKYSELDFSVMLKGQKAEAVDALLNLEKAQRLAEDVGGTRRACQAVLTVRSNSRL